MSHIMKRIILQLLFVIFSLPMLAQGPDVVIPAPAEVAVNDGVYRFRKNPKISLQKVAQEVIPSESYRLEIGRKGITITYSDNAGRDYALQTLK